MAESKFKEYVVGLRDDTNDPYTASVHEPVVRCRDCAYYGAIDTFQLVGAEHPMLRMGCIRQHETCKPDDFCSWGIRRGEVDADV